MATADRRAATVERTDDEVVLKYSLNLLDDPEVAAVEAARAREAQALRAAVVAALLEVVQPDSRTVRSVRDLSGMALMRSLAASPSTAMVRMLVLYVTALSVSSLESPIANGIAPSALNE